MCAKMSSLLSFSLQFVVKKVEYDEEEAVKKKTTFESGTVLFYTTLSMSRLVHHTTRVLK